MVQIPTNPRTSGAIGLLVNPKLPLTEVVKTEVLRMPKPPHPLSAMSYCHMGLNWCSEAIANAVGGKCISYVVDNFCLCLLIQAGNCCCDRGC